MRDKNPEIKITSRIVRDAEYPAFCRWSFTKKYYE